MRPLTSERYTIMKAIHGHHPRVRLHLWVEQSRNSPLGLLNDHWPDNRERTKEQ
jgi:hypothetical protein